MKQLQPINDNMKDAFQRVDELVDKAIALKDLDVAIGAIKQLEELRKITGWSKAYLFYRLRENWQVFGINDNFKDVISSSTEHHPQTIRMYIRSWEALLEAPKETSQKMLSRNIGDYYPVANAVAQGYELDAGDWKEVTSTTKSSSDIGDYVREEVKEAPPRKRRGTLPFMDREGSIYIVDNDGTWLYVGYLNLEEANPEVQQIINRILDRANIRRQ